MIVRMIINRNEDNPIADIKIGIRGRKTLTFEDHWAGHGHGDNLQGTPVLILHGSEPLQVILKGLVILIGRVLLHNRYDGCGIHESREVIHMTIRIITNNAIAQPEDVGDAQIVSEICLNLRLDQMRIAILVEETLLSCEERSFSIDVNRTPFKDNARLDTGNFQEFGNPLRNHIIQIPRPVFLAPGIEDEIDYNEGSCF